MKRFTLFLATGCLLGYVPVAPGTVGTLAGIALFFVLSRLSFPLYTLTIVAFFFLASWVAGETERIYQEKDCSCIVIDEIMGFLVAMATLPAHPYFLFWGFILFRFFDIIKPYPAGVIDRKIEGGFGVVLDDVVAGLYANLFLQVARYLRILG